MMKKRFGIVLLFLGWYVFHLVNPAYEEVVLFSSIILLSFILFSTLYMNRWTVPVNRLTGVYVVFLIALPVMGYLESVNRYITLVVLYRNIGLLLCLFIGSILFSRQENKAVFFLTVGGVIAVLNGMLIGQYFVSSSFRRTVLFLRNPNVMGDILVMGMMIGLGMVKIRTGTYRHPLAAGIVCFFLTGLVLIKSVGAIITLAVSILVMYYIIRVIVNRQRLVTGRMIIIGILCAGIVSGALWLRRNRTAGDPYANQRPRIWRNALQCGRSADWHGVGSGCFNRAARYFNFPVMSFSRYAKSPANPHNLILELSVEDGIAGVVIFFIFILILYTDSLNAVRQFEPSDPRRTSVVISLAYVSGILCHSLVEFPLANFSIAFWIPVIISQLPGTVYTCPSLFRRLSVYVGCIFLLVIPVSFIAGECLLDYSRTVPADRAAAGLRYAAKLIPAKGEVWQRLGGSLRDRFFTEPDPSARQQLRLEAVNYFVRGAQCDRLNDVFYLNCGKVMLELFRPTPLSRNSARYFLAKAIAAGPYNPNTYYQLADLYIQEQNYPRALYFLERISRIEPNFLGGILLRIDVAVRQHRFIAADKLLKEFARKKELLERKMSTLAASSPIYDYVVLLARVNQDRYKSLSAKVRKNR